MNAERTEAYRCLISMLLTYPDRSAKILCQNATLLDAGLMKMMEQVASQMADNKSYQAADFLKSLIAQLQDELTMATGRIKIIQPSDSDLLKELSLRSVEPSGTNYEQQSDSQELVYNQSDKEKIYHLNSKNTYLTNLKNSKIYGRNSNEYSWSKWVALTIIIGTLGLIFIKPIAKPFSQPNFFGGESQNHQ